MSSTMHIRVLILAAMAACAFGCAQIVMGGEGMAYPSQVMSCRNMGFFNTPKHVFDVVGIPKKTKLIGIPVIGSTVVKFPAPTKWGIVCVSSNTKAMAATIANISGDPSVAAHYGGFCSDGMNAAGLSAAYLWNSENNGYAVPDANPAIVNQVDPAKESVTFMDYPTRVLSECSTIECARTLTNNLNIVNSEVTKAILMDLINDDQLPMHATFCDKSAKCIGVEWTAQGVPQIFDLVHNVITNEPDIPVQERLLYQYMNESVAKYNTTMSPLNWPGGTAGYNLAEVGYDFVEPSTRYIRMYMLMQLYGPVKYTVNTSVMSPSYYDDKIAAFLQINSVINYAAEIGAAPSDYPFYQWDGQQSQFVSTRDHIAGVFYLRTTINQNQHRIDVAKQTRGNKIKVKPFNVLMPAKKYAINVEL